MYTVHTVQEGIEEWNEMSKDVEGITKWHEKHCDWFTSNTQDKNILIKFLDDSIKNIEEMLCLIVANKKRVKNKSMAYNIMGNLKLKYSKIFDGSRIVEHVESDFHLYTDELVNEKLRELMNDPDVYDQYCEKVKERELEIFKREFNENFPFLDYEKFLKVVDRIKPVETNRN